MLILLRKAQRCALFQVPLRQHVQCHSHNRYIADVTTLPTFDSDAGAHCLSPFPVLGCLFVPC